MIKNLLIAALFFLSITSCCSRADCQEDIVSPILISEAEFQDLCSYRNWYESSDGKEGYVCFYLTAPWCGPCQALKHTLFLENLHTSVVYIDVDVESAISISLNPTRQGIPRLVRCKIELIDGVPMIVEKVACLDRDYLKFIRDTIQLRRKFRKDNL